MTAPLLLPPCTPVEHTAFHSGLCFGGPIDGKVVRFDASHFVINCALMRKGEQVGSVSFTYMWCGSEWLMVGRQSPARDDIIIDTALVDQLHA